MKDCEFCNLSAEDKKWLLLESEYWLVFLADRQDYIGRCIIVCREHCSDISQLSDNQWEELKKIISALQKTIKAELNATMFNLSCLMNDAYKHANPHPHLHFHLRPRYANPVKIGDTVFTDKEFSHHYNNKADVQVADREIQMIFDNLKESLISSI